MKTVSPALAALLSTDGFASGIDVLGEGNIFAVGDVYASGETTPSIFVPFDLYTFTTPQGLVLTYTTAGFPITAPTADIFDAPDAFRAGRVWTGPMTWTPFPIDVKDTRATAHWKIGLDSDQWQVVAVPRLLGLDGDGYAPDKTGNVLDEGNIFAVSDVFTLADPNDGPDRIGDRGWIEAVAAGALDEADCIVARAYFQAVPRWPIPPAGVAPVGTIILFRGTVGDVEITGSRVTLQLDDYRRALTQQIPRNPYMAGCRHRFGDARCGVDLAAYMASAVASGSSTRASVIASAAVAAPGGSATYTLGLLTMTVGSNAGLVRLVAAWDGVARFDLLAPLPYAIAAGDSFTVSAGCDKRLTTCTAFANLANFGGEPFIPVPETTLA